MIEQIIGAIGLIFVLLSLFSVKKVKIFFILQTLGCFLLFIYSIIKDDWVFYILEGIMFGVCLYKMVVNKYGKKRKI